MKLKQLIHEGMFRYETEDKVKTPFGPGIIVQDLGADQTDHYFGVVFDEEIRQEHNLEDKVYKLGSFQLGGIIKKKALD